MSVLIGFGLGFLGWFFLRCVLGGFFTVQRDQRAVKTSFGRAQRRQALSILDGPLGGDLKPLERDRYAWPQLVVYPPGGPYFNWPWERVHKVSVSTRTHNLALDPEDASANHGGTMLDAVTKDQLDTGLRGQIRYRVSDQNLYAYVADAMFEILETQRLLDARGELALLPKGAGALAPLLLAGPRSSAP